MTTEIRRLIESILNNAIKQYDRVHKLYKLLGDKGIDIDDESVGEAINDLVELFDIDTIMSVLSDCEKKGQ